MRAVWGLAAWLAACVLLEARQVPASLAEPEPFAVSVVRADGVLVPVARFDGRTWVPMWAIPAEATRPPASLAEIPREWLGGLSEAPTAWHLWSSDLQPTAGSPFAERHAQPLGVTGVSPLGARCPGGLGLQTTYATAGAAPPRTGSPAFAGVAVTSAAIRVEPITLVEPGSAIGLAMAEKAVSPFHRAEDDTIGRETEALPARPPAYRDRRAVPVTWTRIGRLGVAQAPTKTYYFEGRKRYGPQLVMTGHVWLQMSAGRETADAEVDLDDDQGTMSVAREPLGAIRVGDRVYWLFRSRGAESTAYEIVELIGPGRPPARVLTVDAAPC